MTPNNLSLINRLRLLQEHCGDCDAGEAADEIERLNVIVKALNETIETEANITLDMINKLCDAVAMIVANKYKD